MEASERKARLDALVTQHLIQGWSLVARVSDESAVVEFPARQPPVRRTLAIDVTGALSYRDGDGPTKEMAGTRSGESSIPAEALARGASPFPWVPILVAFGVLFALVSVALLAGVFLLETDSTSMRRARKLDAQDRASERDIPTLDAFLQIRHGMTYAEVSRIIGRPGELSVSSDSGGAIYSWKRERCCANMSVHFRHGLVISKSQAGLE